MSETPRTQTIVKKLANSGSRADHR